MAEVLRPIVSLSEIYGPGHLFVQRAYSSYADWLPDDPSVLDSLAGGGLPIAGTMPAVCSRGSVTPRTLELLELAGLQIAQDLILFGAGTDEQAVSDVLAQRSEMIVLQHAFPVGVIPGDRMWMDAEQLSYLNNKANLAALVRPENLPGRKVVDRQAYFEGKPSLPIVLKVVTPQSTGAGKGVVVCREPENFGEAEQLFRDSELIVAENFLEIADNPCLNFAVMADGSVRYLGFAEQIVTPEGKHRGNWIDLDATIAQEVIDAAAEPVRRGAELGYRGIAGIDMAITRDGRILVLDLNFRINASTPGLLLGSAIRARHGATIMHFRRMQGDSGAGRLADDLTPFVADGRIVPVSLFDAAAAGYADKPSSALVLVVGHSRDEVLATEDEIAALGIR
jgi:hypothetical protein